MNKFEAFDGDTKFQRISKRAARTAYNAGKPVVLCPVKLYPFGGFRPSMMIQKTELPEYSFYTRVRDFESYNANCNETGYYASFYIEVK